MSTSYTSNKIKVFTAKTFRDSFKESTPRKIGYIFLSKSSEYADENVAPEIVDSVQEEKNVWDNMLLAKKVIPKDVEMIVPRYDWRPFVKYKQYDDTIELNNLTTQTVVGGQTIYPFYVINADGDVYKCLCNNVGTLSTVEPIGNFTENDGFIETADGYLWKYLYNVKRSNKFFTDQWMPVPYIQANTNFTDYNYSSNNAIDGALSKMVVTNNGTDYYHTTINVEPFSAATNEIEISDAIDLISNTRILANMAVSGVGIFANRTYITEIDTERPKIILLSEPTISSGGGNSSVNVITISTRVEIDGDGTETTTIVRLTANNTIRKIDVTNAGINYSKANVTIYGSGSSATARTVLPPKFGHAYNPAVELGASNVMIVSRIGEIDASEDEVFPIDISFRQYGILTNVYKYNENDIITENNSLDLISQTMDLTLLSFSAFNIDEMVYQGNINSPDFIGYVVIQNSNVVKLNNLYKTPVTGLLLTGVDSGSKNPVVSIKYPDLKPYAGDVMFARNILKVNRSVGQAEEIKLVFQF